jgi:Zn-dependent M28 family amino/carboxypeptidase
MLLLLGAGIAKTIAYYDGSADATAYAAVGWAIVGLSPFVGLLALLHTYRSVPGAADNMSAVAVVSGLGRYLNDAKRNGEWVPQRTEILLLSTSSEEAGLRGAKRYVHRHFEEMQKTPTYGLFLEFVCDERLLTVVSRELFTGAKHDPALIRIARDAAASRGQPLAVKTLQVGASDASAFSRKGIPAIGLVGNDPQKLVPNYHTRNDTYDYIRPEALAAALQIVIDMTERIDGMEATP